MWEQMLDGGFAGSLLPFVCVKVEPLPGLLPHDLCFLFRFNRKPKVEKTKPDTEAEPAQKKKKGFLPESKKRQKRTKPVLESAGEKPTSVDKPGAEKGQAKKKNDKKTKRKQAAGEENDAQPGSAKKRKKQPDSKPAQKNTTPSDSNPVKKKKKKPKQKKE